MWKDGVIVKHTPLYLYLPHTAQHKAVCPFSLRFLSIAQSAKLYEGHQAGPASRVQSDSGERSDGSAR